MNNVDENFAYNPAPDYVPPVDGVTITLNPIETMTLLALTGGSVAANKATGKIYNKVAKALGLEHLYTDVDLPRLVDIWSGEPVLICPDWDSLTEDDEDEETDTNDSEDN